MEYFANSIWNLPARTRPIKSVWVGCWYSLPTKILLELMLFGFLLGIVLPGCSGESLQRSSFEMFRTMEREECLRNTDINPEDCYRSAEFDEYQRWRQERLENER